MTGKTGCQFVVLVYRETVTMMWEYRTKCFPAMFQVKAPIDVNTCRKCKGRKATNRF